MIGALQQMEAGRKAEDVAREVGVSKRTIYGGWASLESWSRNNHFRRVISRLLLSKRQDTARGAASFALLAKGAWFFKLRAGSSTLPSPPFP